MRGRLPFVAALLGAAVLLPTPAAHANAEAPDRPATRSFAPTDVAPARAALIPVPPLPKSALRRLVARPSRIFAALDPPRLTTLPRVSTITVRSTRLARQLHRIATDRPEGWAAVCMNLTVRNLFREVYAATQRELSRSGRPATPDRIESAILAAAYALLGEVATSVVPYGTHVAIFQAVKELTDGDVGALFDLVCA
jgi:hypothetical protein